jgi:ketosteroid isomerase-like protein
MDEVAVAAPREGPFEESRRAFLAALERGDPGMAAQVYASDARLLVPSAAPLDGRPSIEAFWRAGIDAGMCSLEMVPETINVDTTFACEVGAYTLESAPLHETRVTEHGRYIVVQRLEADGTWRRALEMYAPQHD